MASERIVVGQSPSHLWGLTGIAALLAILGVVVVNRPLEESYPAALLIMGLLAPVGVHIFSSRLILDGDQLMLRRYGLTLWRISIVDARFTKYVDDAGWFAWRVSRGQQKIGSIQAILFDPRQLGPLLEELGLR